MTSHLHAAVWLDHHEAKIFHVDEEGSDEKVVRAAAHHVHRHPKGSSEQHLHPEDAPRFFKEIAHALADVTELLILGPSTAKLQFVRHLHAHDRALEAKVVGIETVDHPTDAQLVAHVKAYFDVAAKRGR